MARQSLDLVDPRIAKALSHPMRTRILAILDERVASPNEIADIIGERLPNVSYHVRTLLDLGCIELVSTAQRRGAIEHYYRAVLRPFFSDRDWKRLPRSGRKTVSDVALQMIWDDVSGAVNAGTFEGRPERHLTHTSFELDERGWEELNDLLDRALLEAEAIAARSAECLASSDEGAIPTRLVLMHFESPSQADEQ
ncbi:MAG TPA: helix-turn-helix domain-containing protein [Solirubrobacteraceae bacterium]|nr:helix-turn-helix domain-containing protein [Solirubrobacteraceae bacterium]